MSVARYEVFPDDAGEWRWHLMAANNEIVAQSEGYTTEAAAWEGTKAAHRAALEACEPIVFPGKIGVD